MAGFRGWSAPPPRFEPPSFPFVSSVEAFDPLLGVARVHWSVPVGIDDVTPPNANFKFGGQTPDALIDLGGGVTEVYMPLPIVVGQAWAITAQPNWVTEPVIVPEAGLMV